jgi:hypothetical protein
VATKVPEPELGVPAQPRRLLPGLAERLSGEVDADQPGAGPPGHLQPVAASAASQIEQRAAGGQLQRPRDLADAIPGQQARGVAATVY